MTIDAILTQPTNCPFPLWSKWITVNQDRFRKIYIALHQKNIEGHDYTDLIQELLRNVKNIEYIEGINPMDGADWRNVAIRECLRRSSSEHVLFLEQDFFIKNTDQLFNELKNNGSFGIKQGNRIHPAFLFTTRSSIEATSKDFSPIEVDHFGKFTREYEEVIFPIQTQWFHMNGLTQNYTLVQQNQPPNYDLVNFLVYNRKSREILPELTDKWELYDRYVELTFKAETLISPLLGYLGEYV